LRWLNVSYNQLVSLPAEVSRLRYLERLYASNNSLESLPLELWQLKGLEELHVDNNRIRAFPTGILFLPKLREVLLENNPLLTREEADGAEVALLFPPVRIGDCSSCCIRFTNSQCFVSFHTLAQHRHVPIVHYVCSDRCKEQLKLKLDDYDRAVHEAEVKAISPLKSESLLS
jgi:Leucine-rich repeat (LRR) protein